MLNGCSVHKPQRFRAGSAECTLMTAHRNQARSNDQYLHRTSPPYVLWALDIRHRWVAAHVILAIGVTLPGRSRVATWP